MDLSLFTNPGVLSVLAIRLLGPLLIFPYPLLGSLLSEFVFDASDVILWDAFGSLRYIDYTAWDKAMDMYQLVIQAIVVWGWQHPNARKTGLWLFGYRLAGFLLYEVTKLRIFFLIFPNIFVLYFITYLVCAKLGKKAWFDSGRTVALILVVLFLLKMPQEYILHYLEIPTWDVIKGFLHLA